MAAKRIFETVFILDQSGSMQRVREGTIGTFNSLISEFRSTKDEVLVSLVLFSDEVTPLFTRSPIAEVSELTAKDYSPNGCTALCDAAGETISAVLARQNDDPPEEKPGKTFFIIITDGLENASRKFTGDAVRALVNTTKEACRWEYSFYGANFDAVEVGESYGFSPNESAAFSTDFEGMRELRRKTGRKFKKFLD